jgi:hypothetical protein
LERAVKEIYQHYQQKAQEEAAPYLEKMKKLRAIDAFRDRVMIVPEAQQ